jgi:LmbE family N-acetylglucosaminyl deacetylase
MGCDSLYLSPHLDDAVLSCAARIRQETGEGKRVFVVSVFTGADASREPLYRRRRAEDVGAIASLGATAVHLGLLDAPFRRSYYSSFRSIVLGSHPGDAEDEDTVRRVLEDVLRTDAPQQVFCPLGVGTHIDHRLTYQAAVAVHDFRRLIFYEDRPYVLVPGQLAMRLADLSLQGDVPIHTPADFLKAFRAAHHVRTYLPENEREECEALLLRKLPAALVSGRRLRSEMVTASCSEEILAAIARYETQLADLYGGTAGLCRESLRYGAGLGRAGFTERYWQEDCGHGRTNLQPKPGGRTA